MKIHLATDHAGFALKEEIKKFLQENGHKVTDHGALEYNKQDDYPDFILPAARAVAKDPSSFGIIMGGSGQGEAMAANRVKGVRAAVYYGEMEEIVRLSRKHNNANILTMPARHLKWEEIILIVDTFLRTKFQNILNFYPKTFMGRNI